MNLDKKNFPGITNNELILIENSIYTNDIYSLAISFRRLIDKRINFVLEKNFKIQDLENIFETGKRFQLLIKNLNINKNNYFNDFESLLKFINKVFHSDTKIKQNNIEETLFYLKALYDFLYFYEEFKKNKELKEILMKPAPYKTNKLVQMGKILPQNLDYFSTTLLDLLKKNIIIKIPSYQRNFKWEEDRVLDFFKNFKKDFGLIIANVKYDKKINKVIFTVIDGQQRIISALIILQNLNFYDAEIIYKNQKRSISKLLINNTLSLKIDKEIFENTITDIFNGIFTVKLLNKLPDDKKNKTYYNEKKLQAWFLAFNTNNKLEETYTQKLFWKIVNQFSFMFKENDIEIFKIINEKIRFIDFDSNNKNSMYYNNFSIYWQNFNQSDEKIFPKFLEIEIKNKKDLSLFLENFLLLNYFQNEHSHHELNWVNELKKSFFKKINFKIDNIKPCIYSLLLLYLTKNKISIKKINLLTNEFINKFNILYLVIENQRLAHTHNKELEITKFSKALESNADFNKLILLIQEQNKIKLTKDIKNSFFATEKEIKNEHFLFHNKLFLYKIIEEKQPISDWIIKVYKSKNILEGKLIKIPARTSSQGSFQFDSSNFVIECDEKEILALIKNFYGINVKNKSSKTFLDELVNLIKLKNEKAIKDMRINYKREQKNERK